MHEPKGTRIDSRVWADLALQNNRGIICGSPRRGGRVVNGSRL